MDGAVARSSWASSLTGALDAALEAGTFDLPPLRDALADLQRDLQPAT